MTPAQIFLYVLVALLLFVSVRKLFLGRLIPQYSVDEVAKHIEGAGTGLLLDVRTRGERASQHIQGSLHIPLHQLEKRIDELQKHQNKEIICYCQTGSRSLSAAIRLKKHGFTVANLKGGIAEWNFVHRRV